MGFPVYFRQTVCISPLVRTKRKARNIVYCNCSRSKPSYHTRRCTNVGETLCVFRFGSAGSWQKELRPRCRHNGLKASRENVRVESLNDELRQLTWTYVTTLVSLILYQGRCACQSTAYQRLGDPRWFGWRELYVRYCRDAKIRTRNSLLKREYRLFLHYNVAQTSFESDPSYRIWYRHI